jgi:hypothetical protein
MKNRKKAGERKQKQGPTIDKSIYKRAEHIENQ